VVQQGVVVSKANSGFLVVIALKSSDPAIGKDELSDLLASNVLDQISRVPGVGSTQLFGGQYSMNIWLNPDKLHAYGLSASEVLAAVRAQNVQFSAGQVGSEPSPDTQMFTASVAAEGRFTKPEEFENILLRANEAGAAVRLKDVARVEVSGSAHGFDLQWNGQPAAGFAVSLAPGENALEVAAAVKARMAQLQASFPKGVEWFTPYDTSDFVRISVDEVIKTLAEAMVLVFLVMLLFLQNIRATLIPTLVIPVALLGTFLGMYVLGFTINQLSLFGMVLAIGIVVDDAIVVIENVERIMTEEGLSPVEATRKAMHQITGAVIAITLVLAAVFIPSALQAGSAGAVYKQFALTIAMAMLFSAFLALGFTPALCASLLKPSTHHENRNPVFRVFNKYYEKMGHTYVRHVGSAVRHAPRWMMVFLGLAVACGFLFWKMPGSFLPEEDQGYAFAIVQLPPGATLRRTNEVFETIRSKVEKLEGFDGMMQVSGFSFIGQGENVGMAFIKLKPWDQRKINAKDFIQNANMALFPIRDAQIFVANLPTVNGLGQFGGFDMYLQDRTGQGRDALMGAMGTLLGKAGENKALVGVRPNTLEPSPQLKLDVDRVQAQAMGLDVGDIYSAIQVMLAPVYVNDFVQGGRVKRVQMQADAAYRTGAESLSHFYTPTDAKDCQRRADDDPAVERRAREVGGRRAFAHALQRIRRGGDRGFAGPGPQLGRSDERDAIDRGKGPAGGLRLRLGRPIAPGNPLRQPDHDADDPLDRGGVPVPGGVVRKLVGAGVRAAGGAGGRAGRGVAVDGARIAERHLLQDRPDHGHRPGREERDPDRRVRDPGTRGRQAARPGGGGSLEAATASDPDDLHGLHHGRVAAGDFHGAGANARHAIGTGVIGGMLAATFLGLLFIPVFYTIVRRLLGDKMDEVPKHLPYEHESTL
jgi:multidrug efflux pump